MSGVYLFAAITFTLGTALAGAAVLAFADAKALNDALNEDTDSGAVEGLGFIHPGEGQ